MKSKIHAYPTITRKLLDEIKCSFDLKFFTKNKKEIQYRIDNEHIILTESSDGLYVPGDELTVVISGKIGDTMPLYGNKGILSEGSAVCIVLTLLNRATRTKLIKIVKEINKNVNDTTSTFECEHTFEKDSIYGQIEISIEVYEKSINVETEKKYFYEVPGIYLGSLCSYTLVVDGTASNIPINLINDNKKPLWYIECNYEDPAIDRLDDSFCIKLNKAHPLFKYIEIGSSQFKRELLNEICASGVCILIARLKMEDSRYFERDYDDLEDASLLRAVYDILRIFYGDDVRSFEICDFSVKLRNYLDREVR